MSKRKIITFSGRMRSGKDVLCGAMKEAYGAKTFSMATHLKKLCCGILSIEIPFITWNIESLNWWKNNRGLLFPDGIKLCDESVQLLLDYTGFKFEDVYKACPEIVFCSVRDLVQIIGTDVIRTIEPDWHIKKTLKDISELPDGTIACIDDVRFKNELEAFKKSGADSFFVIRCNAENISNHESETSLTHTDFPDNRIIVNDGSIESLCKGFISRLDNRCVTTNEPPLLLSDYTNLKDCNREFGMQLTPIVTEILRQNRDREAFVKEGLITFRNNKDFNIKEVLDGMNIANTYSYEQKGGRFIIHNPTAYENLKRFWDNADAQ